MPAQDTELRVFYSDEPLPDGAEDLFGTEAREAWLAHRQVEGRGSRAKATPACVGVASGDGRLLAGAFVLLDEVEGGERVASIRQLVIPPTFRGRGLGGRVIRRVMSLATESGCSRVRSTAGWGCPDHLSMYERMRFERAASSDRPYLVSRAVEASGE